MRLLIPLLAATLLQTPLHAEDPSPQKKTDLDQYLENRGPAGRAEGLAAFLKEHKLEKNAVLLGDREDSALLAEVPIGPGARAAVLMDPDSGKSSVIRQGPPDPKTGKRPLLLVPVDAKALAEIRKNPEAGLKALRAASVGKEASEIPYPFHAQLYKAATRIAANRSGPAGRVLTDCLNGVCSAGVAAAKEIPYGEKTLFDAFAQKTAKDGLDALEKAYERRPPGFVANRVPSRVYSQVKKGLEDETIRRERIERAVFGAIGNPAVPKPDYPSDNAIANEALESTLLYKLSRKKD